MYTNGASRQLESRKVNDLAVGETFRGIFVKTRQGKGGFSVSHYFLVDGVMIRLYGTTVLNRKITVVESGEEVSIHATEERTSTSGYPYKIFEIKRDQLVGIDVMKAHVEWSIAVQEYRALYQIRKRKMQTYSMHCPKCDGTSAMVLYCDSNRFMCHKCLIAGDVFNWLQLVDVNRSLLRYRQIYRKCLETLV